MKTTVTVKTEKELIRDYGDHWRKRKFKVHDMDMEAYVFIHPEMVGMTLSLEAHEYEYYQETGVIRWSDESLFFGMAYITKEMMVGTGKYSNSVIVDDIYTAKHEPIRLKTSSSYIIQERIIEARMNLVKLKC